MGIRFSASLTNEVGVSREQRLWRAVLVNAIEESTNMQQDRKSSIYKGQAYVWLINKDGDFEQVCNYGNFDPLQVSNCYHEAVDKGKVWFSETQIAWIRYHRQFNIYKNCKEHDSRVYHRKRMEHLRNCVNRSSPTLISMVSLSLLI
jgi:hypothetical protein